MAPDSLERKPGKTWRIFHSIFLISSGNGDQTTCEVTSQAEKPFSPAADGGFIRGHG